MLAEINHPILIPNVVIAESTITGFGVFAGRDYKVGEIVEESPVLIVENLPTLTNYLFRWNETQSALALGYGSLYNHSENPNLQYEAAHEHRVIRFTARVDIVKGEELTVYYGEKWFSERDMPIIPQPQITKKKAKRHFLDLCLFALIAAIFFFVIRS